MNNDARLARLESKLSEKSGIGPVIVIIPQENETAAQARERTMAQHPGVVPGHIVEIVFVEPGDSRVAA